MISVLFLASAFSTNLLIHRGSSNLQTTAASLRDRRLLDDQLVVGPFRELYPNHAATITGLHLFAAQDSPSSFGSAHRRSGTNVCYWTPRAPFVFGLFGLCLNIFEPGRADRDQTGVHRMMLSALGRIALWLSPQRSQQLECEVSSVFGAMKSVGKFIKPEEKSNL
jgi:hypothetical protein